MESHMLNKSTVDCDRPGEKQLEFNTAQSVPNAVNSAAQQCCLAEDGIRCSRISGNASYSKKVQKTVQQKKLRLTIDSSARHVYICDHHKNIIQSVRTCVKRKRRNSCDDENGDCNDSLSSFGERRDVNERPNFAPVKDLNCDHPTVDLSILQMNTLRRYKKYFHVQGSAGFNKSQLADTLLNHFRTIQLDEKETIAYYIYMVKSNRNKLDHQGSLYGSSFEAS